MSELLKEIEDIWSPTWLVHYERRLWLAVMQYQHRVNPELVSFDDIQWSKSVTSYIDLERINRREMETKHDLKARLDEFCHLSGHQHIHLGMTSADVVENTYYIRIKDSLTVHGLVDKVPELPFRGIRGPIGSDADQLDLLGSAEHVDRLNKYVAGAFGFRTVANAVTQNMPRSYDFMVASALMPHFPDGPHRLIMNGLLTILADQQPWLEGDVSTSVVRRYVWPMIFTQLALAKDRKPDEQTPNQDY